MKSNTNILFALLFLLLLQQGFVNAQGNIWESTGGPNYGLYKVFADSEENLYAIFPYSTLLFRSGNGGQDWQRLSDVEVQLNNILDDGRGRLYGVTDSLFLLYSDDRGSSWLRLQSIRDVLHYSIDAFFISSNGTLYAAAGGLVYRSTDRGELWIESETRHTLTILSFVENSNGDLFYNAYGRIFRSTDGGATWNLVGRVRDADFLKINSRDELFAFEVTSSDRNRVHHSSDAGKTWSLLQSIPLTDINDATILANDDILLATRYTGVLRSTDNGSTWQRASGISAGRLGFLSQSPNGSTYAGSQRGGAALYRWSDAEQAFEVKAPDFSYNPSRIVAVSPKGTLFTGGHNGMLWRSSDGGNTWSHSQRSFDRVWVVDIEFADNGDVLIANQGGGIFRSTDEGVTWWNSCRGLPATEVSQLFRGPGGRVYAGLTNHGLYYSDDNGFRWQTEGGEWPYRRFFPAAADAQGSIFTYASGTGIIKSTDAGVSWSVVSEVNLDGDAKAVSVNSRGHIFIALPEFPGSNDGGIFRSMDEGESWVQVMNGVVLSRPIDILITEQDHIYVCGSSYGNKKPPVILSRDNGESWEDYSHGLTRSSRIYGMAIDTAGRLYAATDPLGVWRTKLSTTDVQRHVEVDSGSVRYIRSYPNPAQNSMMITFYVPRAMRVTLSIYDLPGNKLATLVNEYLAEGAYSTSWDCSSFANGEYFCRLYGENLQQSSRLCILR